MEKDLHGSQMKFVLDVIRCKNEIKFLVGTGIFLC